MRKLYIIITILFITSIMTGCTKAPTITQTITPTHFQKQPIPQRPLIRGEFSGLADNTLVTLHIRTTAGEEIQWGTRRGNGPWESVIPNNPDVDYIVTAEADAYQSTPISYSIHVDGTTAFLIEDEQVTFTEAQHLDFHFDSIFTATPTK